jgi:hypothetical protein
VDFQLVDARPEPAARSRAQNAELSERQPKRESHRRSKNREHGARQPKREATPPPVKAEPPVERKPKFFERIAARAGLGKKPKRG